LMDIFLS